MKILWIFLGGHHKIRLYLGVISMHFWVFLRSMYRMGVFWGVAKISNIFGGSWNSYFFFLFFFLGGGVWTVDAGPEPKCEEKMRVPPPAPPPPRDCRMATTKSCRFVRGRDATVALPAWIVLAPYRIVEASWAFVSIRSSTVVNRSAAVMSRSRSVDESCWHRRSTVRHRIDTGISFFPSRRIPMQPDFTICLKSGWVVVNRGLNRDSVTGA